jgi:hypothetical protein
MRPAPEQLVIDEITEAGPVTAETSPRDGESGLFDAELIFRKVKNTLRSEDFS